MEYEAKVGKYPVTIFANVGWFLGQTNIPMLKYSHYLGVKLDKMSLGISI